MEDFDDPSDFIADNLQELDKHLRCPICKELIRTPLSLASCSHTFCAACIRRSMTRESCCPMCRVPSTEQQLHNNHTLENIVNVWKTARKQIIDLEKSNSPSRLCTAIPTQQDQGAVTKPSLSFNNVVPATINSSTPPQTVRRSTRSVKGKEVDTSTPIDNTLTNESLVTCPICFKSMQMAGLNAHIDRCIEGEDDAFQTPFVSKISLQTPKKRLGKPPKKPTRFVYGMQSDKEMRAVLADLGLPVHGNKRLLVWRHKEYTLLYNINKDTREPEDDIALKHRLKSLEEDYLESQKRIPQKSTKHHEEYNASHKKKYHEDYERLIEEAKRRRITVEPHEESVGQEAVSEHP